MEPTIHCIADRPDLAAAADDFPQAWPTFMYHDPISRLFYQEEWTSYAEFCVVAVDPDVPDRVVAKALAMPITLPGYEPGVGDNVIDTLLPPGGYDDVMRIAALDRLAGRRGNLISPAEVAVQADQRGRGLSGTILRALCRHLAGLGYADLIVPVRPSAKHEVPHEPMEQYLARVRGDGLPADPWLRVHVRAGGRIVSVAHRSMTIPGTLAEWREWTGLPFDRTGPVVVPQALVPVHCDVTAGHAVYVEPNVWIHHKL